MDYSRDSDLHWVKMAFDVPIDAIMKEYNAVKNDLITHRPDDGHKMWQAVTLYGLGADYTNSHWEYDRRTKKSLTSAGINCPITMKWVESLPYARIDDVRFLVIEPGGFIKEHVDVPEHNWLDPLNIAIHFPDGSEFIMEGEQVPYASGTGMVLNIHKRHGVRNNSSQQRIHLLVHGKKKQEFWNYVEAQR